MGTTTRDPATPPRTRPPAGPRAPAAAGAPARPRTRPARRARPAEGATPGTLPRWSVVLLDDDDHTYEYVVEMLGRLFGHDLPTAWRIATEVDGAGRSVLWCGPREVAEWKQEQVHAFGADPRVASCRGSMTAVLERLD